MKDNNTPDLFADTDADDYQRQARNVLETVTAEAAADTADIWEEYLKRPGHLETQSLGAWLNSAHKLHDRDLANAAGLLATKLEILRKGYNRLPLEPLKAWNDRFNYKGK